MFVFLKIMIILKCYKVIAANLVFFGFTVVVFDAVFLDPDTTAAEVVAIPDTVVAVIAAIPVPDPPGFFNDVMLPTVLFPLFSYKNRFFRIQYSYPNKMPL